MYLRHIRDVAVVFIIYSAEGDMLTAHAYTVNDTTFSSLQLMDNIVFINGEPHVFVIHGFLAVPTVDIWAIPQSQ